MTGYFKTLMILLTVIASIACSDIKPPAVDNAKEKQMIEKSIRGAIGWAKDKNLSFLYNIIANDTSFLEVHPGPKVVKGFSDFRKAEEFWMSPDFKAVKYEIGRCSLVVLYAERYEYMERPAS
jgi:hypothetical protein